MKSLRVLAAALLAGATLTSVAPAAATASKTTYPDWYGYHGSKYRGGYSSAMPAASGVPKVIRKLNLDGAVYASPIVIRGDTIVATENDTVYVLGPKYNVRFKIHLGSPSPASERPCGNIDPLGITGTPVYGSKFNVVYVAAELGHPVRHVLYAISLATGHVRWHRSLDLPGVDATAMQERGALTVAGKRVFVPFGGLAGDCGAYKGRVIGTYRDGSSSQISYTVPTTREAGIWTPPGPVVDSHDNLYVSVGNGESGVGDPYDHSDSVLKLSSASLHLMTYFSPSTWPTDNDADLDLGSLGPTLVQNRYVFAAGKSGRAYTMRKDALGGIGGQVHERSLCAAFGGTAVHGSVVYVPCTDGLRAVHITSGGGMVPLWHAASDRTGSPVVGGGRVWTLAPDSGQLYALSPQTGQTYRHVYVGTTSRFATPAIYGRNLVVPTLSGVTVVSTS